MAQWLKVLAVIPEDADSIPCAHMVTHNFNSSSRESDVLFWIPQAPAPTHTVYTRIKCMHAKYTQIKIKIGDGEMVSGYEHLLLL